MAKKAAAPTPTKQSTHAAITKPTSSSSKPISSPAPSAPVVSKPTATSSTSLTSRSSAQEIVFHVWDRYLNDTPTRTLLLDVFMAFLVLNGAVQFLYCLLAGNYPFNAFLSGFSAAVGQFVLTASLRMQTTERPPPTASAAAKKASAKSIDSVSGEITEEGKSVKISSERAFADYILGSLILHAFCVNFIN